MSVVTAQESAPTTSTDGGYLREVFPSPQGEGPHVGRLHIFVRLLGCAVGCRFCDTPDSLSRGGSVRVHGSLANDVPSGESGAPAAGQLSGRRVENPISVDDLASVVAEILRDRPGVHAISITGGEPLEQTPFLVRALPRLVEQRPVLLETAGTRPDDLERVIERVAIVSMDMKLPSVAGTAPCFDAHKRFLEIATRKETYVKVVVNDQVKEEEFVTAARIVADVANKIPFIIQPETRRDGQLAASFPRLTSLADRASSAGLADVRILPQVHKYLRAP